MSFVFQGQAGGMDEVLWLINEEKTFKGRGGVLFC